MSVSCKLQYNSNMAKDVAVLMVPFPLQGHLNQLLHLSRLISAHGVPVHYVGTATHNRQARRRIEGWDPLSISNIIFHEFKSPSFKTHPPNPNSSIKFPSHLQPLFDSLPALRGPVTNLLDDLSSTCRRVVVIYDSLMGSVIQDFVHFPNAESYIFHSVSAYTIFFFLWESQGRPFAVDKEVLENLPSLDGCFTPEFLKFVLKQHKYLKLNSGRIYNTCRAVESPFLDLLERPQISGPRPEHSCNSNSNPKHKCLKWLDSQARNSVIFVSFGTTTTLSERQIHELAMGLEKAEVNFIWALREADGGDGFSGELPRGFEERVRERGVVERDWVPQLEILGHCATGGFMSHCGWNSCIESISMGVPIAAWPMHSDQPRNTVLVTEVLKIGLVVKDWSRGNEVVKAAVVERAVRKLMVSSEGAEMRKRAADLGGAVRNAVADGGLTTKELDSFISHITR